MSVANYIKNLTNRVFKALPLREDGMEVAGLMQYVFSLYIDAMGYQVSHPELCDDKDFQMVVNALACLGTIEVSPEIWRSEILSSMHALNAIEARFGGEDNG